MTESGRVPQSGSLSARVIRACPEHKQCPLTCPKRQVEDLGEIARFSQDQPRAPLHWWQRIRKES